MREGQKVRRNKNLATGSAVDHVKLEQCGFFSSLALFLATLTNSDSETNDYHSRLRDGWLNK